MSHGEVPASLERIGDALASRIQAGVELGRRTLVRPAERRRQFLSALDFAEYLLPNSVSVRFTESADLLNLWHKHAMRLCYNAQEEIWQASVEEAELPVVADYAIGS